MTTLSVLLVALIVVFVALVLAFGSLRLLMDFVSRSVVAPVRAFMERQRERRAVDRPTPDRRGPG
jgi:hypothetical protein